ncbi:hypothetical protein, partial [Shewanella sp. SM35]|uniref:hypothetical protein n=1 Tax=Shewanella sp. SM35 TaxID=2912797 RepID=UPI0021D7F93B
KGVNRLKRFFFHRLFLAMTLLEKISDMFRLAAFYTNHSVFVFTPILPQRDWLYRDINPTHSANKL